MSRFEREWALVPRGARWTATFVCLGFTLLMGSIFLAPVIAEGSPTAALVMAPAILALLVGVAFLAVYVLLVGYIYADAQRRGMKHVMWTLLAIFIPNAVGIILYFILRDPVAAPCPSCGARARKGHAYCAACGQALRAACSQCREPVEPGWRNCARCGASIASLPGAGSEAAPVRSPGVA